MSGGGAFAALLAVVLVGCTGGGRVSYTPATRDAGEPPIGDGLVPDGCRHTVRHDPALAPIEPGADVFGRSPEPMHVHLSFPADASTTMAFAWETDRGTYASSVELGTSADRLDRRAIGHTFVLDAGADDLRRLHEVHVCGLAPGTTYHYRVGGPEAWSEVRTFKTAPRPGDTRPVRFAVIGDSRDAWHIWGTLAEAARVMRPDFVVHLGDFVRRGTDQEAWDSAFEAAAGLFAEAPVLVAHGNHEGNALNYYAQFVFPGNEEWFDVRYGDLHFVFLNDTPRDAETIEGDQHDFLESVLSGTDARWRFAAHHKPAYSSCTTHGSNARLQAAWTPLYDRYDLDIDLAAHDHIYERTLPIADGVVVPTAAEGTVYTTNGGGGAVLYDVGVDYFSHVAESVNHFTFVTVDGGVLTWRTYRLDGSLLDEMILTH